MQDPEVIINGQRDAQISSFDRGLTYGDGVFETIAVKNGELIYWDEHISRLKQGCEVLGIQFLDEQILKSEADSLIQNNQNCVIKIIITRGVGGRGYKPSNNNYTRIIQKHSWPDNIEQLQHQSIKITQCDIRISRQSKLAQIKHLNRLEQVLARSEWDDEFHEGLVCDTEDNIIEATSSNVFFEYDGGLITPDLSHSGVAGVMRSKVIEFCLSHDISIETRDFKLAEISNQHGILLCNSILGLRQVHAYCGKNLAKTVIIERLIAAFNH